MTMSSQPLRLTEAQAWETLARFFERITDPNRKQGLCHQTNCLASLKLIDFDLAQHMSVIIHRELHRLDQTKIGAWGAYFYPLTLPGARKRAKFCWRQVRRLRRLKRKRV